MKINPSTTVTWNHQQAITFKDQWFSLEHDIKAPIRGGGGYPGEYSFFGWMNEDDGVAIVGTTDGDRFFETFHRTGPLIKEISNTVKETVKTTQHNPEEQNAEAPQQVYRLLTQLRADIEESVLLAEPFCDRILREYQDSWNQKHKTYTSDFPGKLKLISLRPLNAFITSFDNPNFTGTPRRNNIAPEIGMYSHFMKLDSRRIHFKNDAAKPFVRADLDILSRVWANLIRNYIKHSSGSELNVTCANEGKNVVITFADDGKGIPDDKKETIFERGYTTGGDGIGLDNVKSIIEENGGTVHVEDTHPNNEEGQKGAKFIVKLPHARFNLVTWGVDAIRDYIS